MKPRRLVRIAVYKYNPNAKPVDVEFCAEYDVNDDGENRATTREGLIWASGNIPVILKKYRVELSERYVRESWETCAGAVVTVAEYRL